MIEIDGSYGEGGGQVIRSSLALSILTHRPLHVTNIRPNRPKPGLQPQHLKSVDAAAAICRAEVRGAALNSRHLTFTPGELRSGRYKFEIGTAGSTALLLQTIFLPLSMAGSASSVIITGGTHGRWAPCFEYLEMHWLAFMRYLGFNATISLDEAGFYPQGGGRISATIRPLEHISSLNMPVRGELRSIHGISAVANLDAGIADRQKRQALGRLISQFPALKIKRLSLPSRFKGTLLLLQAWFDSPGAEHPCGCCYYGLGERGKPAERVADEAVDALGTFLNTDGAMDQYLADQLLLPLAFAESPSRFRTAQITSHLHTNAWVIEQFGAAHIEIDGETGHPGWVRVVPVSQR